MSTERRKLVAVCRAHEVIISRDEAVLQNELTEKDDCLLQESTNEYCKENCPIHHCTAREKGVGEVRNAVTRMALQKLKEDNS